MRATKYRQQQIHPVICRKDVPERPKVKGKFFYVGEFRPDFKGNEYHDLKVIDRDFAQMAANGINAVRIPHTMPPRLLLDIAHRHGLHVMVGNLPEEEA